MSKRSNSSTSPHTQARTAPTPWLGLALVMLAVVAVIGVVVWMAQQSQRSAAAALTAKTPALSAMATNAADAAPAPATATTLTAADGVTALPAAGPRIAVEQTLFDYGDVQFNTPVETIVRVRNAGNDVLALAENPRVELVEGC